MKKEELYVSVAPEIYRKSKSNVLLNQVDLLQTLKRLHNLKILSNQKYDLKEQLHGLLTSTLSQIDSIQEKMPTPKMPKTIQKHEEIKIKQQIPLSKRDEIEDELKLIQAKLQELNS